MSKFRVTVHLTQDEQDIILPDELVYVLECGNPVQAARVVKTCVEALGLGDAGNAIDVEEWIGETIPDSVLHQAEKMPCFDNLTNNPLISNDGMPSGLIVVVDHSLTQAVAVTPEADLITDRYSRFVLVGPGIPEMHKPTEDMPCLVHCGHPITGGSLAVPFNLGGQRVGFGGRFVRSKDNSFMGGIPIPVFECL